MSVPLDPNSTPEELFESFVESGVEDFKAFLAKYPQHAEGLQEIYERREQVARELEESLMAESFLHRSTRLGDGPFASAFRVQTPDFMHTTGYFENPRPAGPF